MGEKGGWKQTTSYPKRMQQGIRHRQEVQKRNVEIQKNLQAKATEPVSKRCARCGNDSHTTRQHDAEHRKLQKLRAEKLKPITNRVAATQTLPVTSPPVTHRARKLAKKRFVHKDKRNLTLVCTGQCRRAEMTREQRVSRRNYLRQLNGQRRTA